MPVGGDVAYVTRLWWETGVAVDRRGPRYVVGEDAPDRVTYVPRPIGQELGFVAHLLSQPWFRTYSDAARCAIATKLLRIHLFGVVARRTEPSWWSTTQRHDLARITGSVLNAASDVASPLSRADHALIGSMLDPGSAALTLIERAHARRRHGSPQTLLPAHVGAALDREAPLRFMTASWWAQR